MTHVSFTQTFGPPQKSYKVYVMFPNNLLEPIARLRAVLDLFEETVKKKSIKSPLVMLHMEKTMVAKGISKLKSVYRLKIFFPEFVPDLSNLNSLKVKYLSLYTPGSVKKVDIIAAPKF